MSFPYIKPFVLLLPPFHGALLKPTFDVFFLGNAHEQIDEQVLEILVRNLRFAAADNFLLQ